MFQYLRGHACMHDVEHFLTFILLNTNYSDLNMTFHLHSLPDQEEDALLIEEKIRWGDGFLIVYSVTDRCSFDEVMRLCFLVNHIHAGANRGRSNAEPPPTLIVANKKDLEYDRMVTPEDGENLSRGLKLPFHEISARDSWEETAAVFHALYADVAQQLDASPPSFRRRAVSKLMEKIPRIHSGTALGATGRSFSFGSFRDYLPE